MILGITGGIGSGKSLVTEILKETGSFTVLKTDEIARDLMNGDEQLKKKLKDLFGPDIYDSSGSLNKEVYSSLIYSDPENLKKSNETVHPAVWKKVRSLVADLRQNNKNAVVETALPGAEFRNLCDKIWYITADRSVRIQRLMDSRGYSKEYAESVIKKQKGDFFYRSYSDLVINNDGTVEMLRDNVLNNL